MAYHTKNTSCKELCSPVDIIGISGNYCTVLCSLQRVVYSPVSVLFIYFLYCPVSVLSIESSAIYVFQFRPGFDQLIRLLIKGFYA